MDIQNERPENEIEIDKVGIKNLKYPIKVWDKSDSQQRTVGNINMYVCLPKKFRGVHMSRFIEVLEKYKDTIALKNMKSILSEIMRKFAATKAIIEIEMPYFIEKFAPVSKIKSLMEYECKLICALTKENGFEYKIGVSVPVSTLCPCSKSLNKKGAHNQRAKIKVIIKPLGFFWIEDLISIVEDCASSQVYTLLKREDEKVITAWAYKHPTFVEDVVRNVAKKLNDEPSITWYEVEVESYESIHNHDAYAYIKKKN